MQNAAAISTVSWISTSVAPAARAFATASAVTIRPLTCTRPAILSSARILPETGAVPASASVCRTAAAPPGSCAAAVALCELAQ